MVSLHQTAHRRRPPSREVRVFALSIAASIALHAALLVVLPGRGPRDTAHVEVLEVTLAKLAAAPAREMDPRPVPVPQDRNKRPVIEKPARAIAQREPDKVPPAAPAPRPLLAAPNPEPAFTTPAAPIEAPSAESVIRRDAVRTTPSPDAAKSPPAAAAGAEPRVTPPNFNAGYLRNPPPRYPLTARRSGEHGTVLLKVLVTSDGLPAEVSVQKTSGSPSLDQAAMEAVRGWRFAPARQGTQPVEAWVLVPIVFKLEGVS